MRYLKRFENYLNYDEMEELKEYIWKTGWEVKSYHSSYLFSYSQYSIDFEINHNSGDCTISFTNDELEEYEDWI